MAGDIGTAEPSRYPARHSSSEPDTHLRTRKVTAGLPRGQVTSSQTSTRPRCLKPVDTWETAQDRELQAATIRPSRRRVPRWASSQCSLKNSSRWLGEQSARLQPSPDSPSHPASSNMSFSRRLTVAGSQAWEMVSSISAIAEAYRAGIPRGPAGTTAGTTGGTTGPGTQATTPTEPVDTPTGPKRGETDRTTLAAAQLLRPGRRARKPGTKENPPGWKERPDEKAPEPTLENLPPPRSRQAGRFRG